MSSKKEMSLISSRILFIGLSSLVLSVHSSPSVGKVELQVDSSSANRISRNNNNNQESTVEASKGGGTGTSSSGNGPNSINKQEGLIPIRKFGEEPTDRVLPVDQLTDADYEEEEQNELQESQRENSDYCARVLRQDLLKVLKKLKSKSRASRQSDNKKETEEEQESLLNNYLEFDPVTLFPPLINIMSSAMARNLSGIDEHYKKLPPRVKTDVNDFIEAFTELLRVPESLIDK